jgi:hypothetical protein
MQAYEVRDGYIVSPGKFECEPVYVPYFWSFYLDGGDEPHTIDGTFVSRFEVTDAERIEFPELVGVVALDLWESDQGFVYHRTYAAGAALAPDDDEADDEGDDE